MFSRELLFTICCLAISDGNVAAESLPDFMTHRWSDAFSTLYGHFSEEVRLEMLQKSREMFTFAYDSYMNYAFPLDELDPIHCSGRGPDEADPTNININDVLGDYSLSLIDSLGTLVIMGNVTEFQKAVKLVVDTVTFDKANTVQVFEANIRVLGSLLSTHLLIEDQKKTFGDLEPDWYAGNLLTMAHDLADRLIMGFDNATFDIPYPRINLVTGVPNNSGRNKISCLAGAGSLLLEFATLSRLLGDPIYEAYARRSTKSIWKRRSNLTGLFGNDIDVETGEWVGTMSGLGAGMDSFYEYLLKSYILLGEESDLEMFLEAYSAIKMHLRRGRPECNRGTGPHPTYVNVNMDDGKLFNTWMDSLQAAIPALQVLHGDLEEAICHHAYYYAIWKRFGFLPERYNWLLDQAEVKFYPLRPEFIESTYFLYQATKNPFYLHVGHDILESLNKHTKVECGYATVHDVDHKTLEDRQESFFLSETCKYLYLLFDVENPVHKKGTDQFLFTTEGHIFPISDKLRRKVWEDENIFMKDHSNGWKGSEPRSNCDSISDEPSECVMQFRSHPPPPSLNSSRSPTPRRNTNPYCEYRGFESAFKLPLKSEYLLQVFNQLGVNF